MQDFIEDKIRSIYSDFQQEAKKAGELCACKELTYAGGNTPDYTNPLVLQNYMLRFFPAYLAEYFLMYMQLFNHKFLTEKLNVLSIGCGSGIDLWGLYFAVKETGKDPGSFIRYTGVDIAPWVYQDKLGLKKVRFLTQNIADWKKMDRNDYNVFVFPKCIGEFPANIFESICKMFEKTQFSEKKVCGLCSLMDKGMNSDADRFRRIAQIMMESHGFHCLDELNNYWTAKRNEGLRAICPSFVYPDDILDRVKYLLNECPTYGEKEKACENDCANLNRWPILRTTSLKYKLLRFERD